MITIKDVQKHSKQHPLGSGRQTKFFNESIEVSIVGGTNGLYGDFIDTFEVAVFDRENRDFLTKNYFIDNQDDVVPYLKSSELEDFLNKVFNEGFQVF